MAQSDRLVPLRTLEGHALAPEEVDIRGWPVVDAAGAALGTVDDLLVDAPSAEVAALLLTRRGRGGAAVLPMADAHIDERRRVVVSDAAPTEARAPARGARAAQPGVTVRRAPDGDEIIEVPIVEERLVVERRPVVKEVVVIRKRAVTEERVVEADLRRERLEVDRRDER